MSKSNIHIIPSKKFKTINIVVKLRAPLMRETVTKRALLPYIFQQGTINYPSERELNLKLDSLYGAIFSVSGTKKGDNHIINFRLEIANQKYIQNESTMIDEALDLLKEIIYQPQTENNVFPERMVNREKATLKNQIESIVDDKITYANRRLIDEMCAGEAFAIHSNGYVDDLETINHTELYDYYKTMLSEDQFDFYVLGDFDAKEMEEKVAKFFDMNTNQTGHVIDQEIVPARSEVKEVIEKQDIQQAKLHLGYRTNCRFADDDYFALQIFNGLFGGFPSSKLFINVREKNSLAYYVASRIESHKGLMFVYSGIAGEDYEKAKTIIAEQFAAMRAGDFTEAEMEATKELIISQFRETEDSAVGTIELAYQQVIGNKEIPAELYFEEIKKVTKADVIRVANNIDLDTIYLLTDEGTGEQNE